MNGAGDVLVSFWIIKADFAEEEEEEEEAKVQIVVDETQYPKRGSWNRYYGSSQAGWVNCTYSRLVSRPSARNGGCDSLVSMRSSSVISLGRMCRTI